MRDIKQERTYIVELTQKEVETIHGITQNHENPDSEEGKIFLGLFVGTGRLLGKPFEDDGSLAAQPRH